MQLQYAMEEYRENASQRGHLGSVGIDFLHAIGIEPDVHADRL